jgi:hypothetical protein
MCSVFLKFHSPAITHLLLLNDPVKLFPSCLQRVCQSSEDFFVFILHLAGICNNNSVCLSKKSAVMCTAGLVIYMFILIRVQLSCATSIKLIYWLLICMEEVNFIIDITTIKKPALRKI